MPCFPNRPTSTTTVVTVVVIAILVVVFWTSMSAPKSVLNSENLKSTNTTIRKEPFQFNQGGRLWTNNGNTLQYRPSDKPVIDEYEAFPDAKGVDKITDVTNIIPTTTDGFPTDHRDVEYVTPLKISENQYEDPSDGPPMAKRHHSGHFRLPTAVVWDPHPQYEFTAFGRIFRLRLAHDSTFISPDVKITHVETNQTTKNRPSHQSGCFYTGYVDGDPTSDVSVSLCDGMTGHVRTSNSSYIISPMKHWSRDSGGTVKHIFYRERKTASNVSRAGGSDLHTPSHHCGVIDYNVEEEAPVAMLDDNSAGDIYVGVRHRDRRSSTTKILRIDSTEDLHVKQFTPTNKHVIYRGNNEVNNRHSHRVTGLENAMDPFYGWRYRRALAREYFIELMVVADAKMIQYHGNDLIPYILVLMSTVHRIYKDPSIGNPLSIAVMKIVTVEQIFGTENRDGDGISATGMLTKFCEWQEVNNPNEPSPEHHDAALLLTRENLCQDPGEQRCETLGLAELGRMCSSGSSCAIVQDNGLATAFTIAHEIGHVLSMPHDDDPKCTKFKINSDVHNFMTRRLDNNTFRWEWSKCSRHYLTEFLENANCLLDEPSNITAPSDMIRLPGENYSGNRQCELAFGPGAIICPHKPEDVCKRLWCTSTILDRHQCRTQNMPWADGTPCGGTESNIKWCHKGQCASVKSLERVNGEWGEWGPYGDCSRTCGGGIQKKYRECNRPPPQNGGDYCIGERVQYRSCRTEECSLDATDFRQEQCSKFDNNNLKIPGLARDVQWHAKYTRLIPEDRCKLFCQVESNQYYMLRNKVIDGTPCGPDTFHICVHGKCKPAGCDHYLDSTAQLDTCGICRGDNSTCHKIAGSHNSSVYGYTRVITIPAGSSNIDIRQHGWNGSYNDSNYLALRIGEAGKYILNGQFNVMHRKVIIRPGLTIEYSGPVTPIERLNSSRPINVDLILEILSVGNVHPPQITYEYTVPKNILMYYTWILGDWSICNYVCDGVKHRKARCQNIVNKEFVPDDYCIPENKPQEEHDTCNTYCSLKWHVTVLSECSNHCGPGNRTISSQCVQILKAVDGETVEFVSNYACSHIERPSNQETCIGPCDDVYWSYGQWGPCSATCGGGEQSRMAICVDLSDEAVDESKCIAREKLIQRICGQETCPQWTFGEWSPCSVTCGQGSRRRPLYCHVENRIVSESHCTSPKPDNSELCDAAPCHRWDTSDWNACNSDCGPGRQHRRVRCKNGRNFEVPDINCHPMKKPKLSRKCHGSACITQTQIGETFPSRHRSKRKWRVSSWTHCSEDCGEGIQQRAVTCHRINRFGWVDPVPIDGCLTKNRPSHVKNCKLRDCDDEYHWSTGNWRKCSHLCGRKGRQIRRIFCHDATGKRKPRFNCPRKFTPKRERKCNQRRCSPRTCLEAKKRLKSMSDGEYTLLMGGKSMSIYCHNTGTEAPREYLTLPAGDRKNYAEIYDKRLLNPNQCPFNGRRNESCDCVHDDGTMSGLTNFKRIRINPRNLIIIADDFTFSRTEGTKRVDFGKAGDCYSRENCPQGRFSIDLTGTLLQLSPEVIWDSQKSKAVMAINKVNDQKITGKCGGYCGFCMPKNGLKLDVLPP